MSRGRRSALLAGLALVLGALAAADVAGREADLRAEIGAAVPVVVAAQRLPAGTRLTPARLAVRQVPERYAPRTRIAAPELVAGLRTAVAVPAGADLSAETIGSGARTRPLGAPVRRGERVAEVTARAPASLAVAGARVDVLVTQDTGGGAGATLLALQDVEVLAVEPAASGSPGGGARDGAGALLVASLRVTLPQAVYLAAAESFARGIRLLPRAAGDRRRTARAVRTGSELPAPGP